MRLDGVGFLRLRASGLDHVRIDRALREPLHFREFFRFPLEYLDELAPDDLSLLLRLADPGERFEEARGGVDRVHFDAQVPVESITTKPLRSLPSGGAEVSEINIRCMCTVRGGFKHRIAPRRRAVPISRPD